MAAVAIKKTRKAKVAKAPTAPVHVTEFEGMKIGDEVFLLGHSQDTFKGHVVGFASVDRYTDGDATPRVVVKISRQWLKNPAGKGNEFPLDLVAVKATNLRRTGENVITAD